MMRSSTDLPRMQNQSRTRAPLDRDLNGGSQAIEKSAKSKKSNKPQMMRQYDLIERVKRYNPNTSEPLLNRAYVYAMKAHGEQKRASGDPYFSHPLEVAAILTDLHLDDATIAAALLHDTIEDTAATRAEIDQMFGPDIGALVDGLTKLKKLDLVTKEAKQAENLRKLLLAIADDVRVLLVKLADRLHNMRTLSHVPTETRRRTAEETLDIYAPLAGRMGMHEMREELEDLAFRELNPDAFSVISERLEALEERNVGLVADIERQLTGKFADRGIAADVVGRRKRAYSIWRKMERKSVGFEQLSDIVGFRVIVKTLGECYQALGVVHTTWPVVPGRFKDYVAMPKFNMYRSLHTTVIGPEGKPLEIQVRTNDMDDTAEYGIAAHWLYKGAKGKKAAEAEVAWMKQLADWQQEETDSRELMRAFPELASDEVYVFTPKGEVKSLPAGATPIDFAYSVHTDVGHRTVGAKVNGRIVPLHYRLRSGDFVEILTSKQAGRGPSRDWLSLAVSSRARNKIRQWFSRETREVAEQRGREALENALKQHNLPYKKLSGSPLLAEIIREMGFKKAEDFYLALGSGKLQVSQVANKVLHRLKTEEVVEEETLPRKPKAREAVASQNFGILVPGVQDVLVRLAKCCTPVPGDEIAGYISLGKGITIHRLDCPNVKALMRNPERFTPVEWDGGASQSFRVQIAVVSWDRQRLLEDVARTFAEHGANIVEYGGHVEDQMAKNWYVAEVGDIKALRALLGSLRNLESVFDAFRVTPS